MGGEEGGGDGGGGSGGGKLSRAPLFAFFVTIQARRQGGREG